MAKKVFFIRGATTDAMHIVYALLVAQERSFCFFRASPKRPALHREWNCKKRGSDDTVPGTGADAFVFGVALVDRPQKRHAPMQDFATVEPGGISLRRRFTVLFDVVLSVALAVVVTVGPLLYRREFFHQTELPKRAIAGLAAFALAIACLFLSPRPTVAKAAPGRRLFLSAFTAPFLFMIWQFAIWSHAAAPVEAFDAVLMTLESMLVFAATCVIVSRSRWATTAGLFGGVLSATAASMVGILQYGVIASDAFPFRIELLRAWRDRYESGEFLGGLLSNIVQTDPPGSLFGHTNVAAEFVAMTLPITVGIIGLAVSRWKSARSIGSSLIVVFGTGALLTALLFLVRSGSRSAILSLFLAIVLTAGVAWGFMLRRRPLGGARVHHVAIFGLALIAVSAVAVIAGKRLVAHPRHGQEAVPIVDRLLSSFDAENTTVRERLDLWANTWTMIEKHPVFGVGPGNYRVTYPAYAFSRREHESGRLTLSRQPEKPHNSYLEILVENGWIGLILWMSSIVLPISLGVRTAASRHRSRDARIICGAAVAAMMVLLGCGLFAFPFQGSATRLLFWFLAGSVTALHGNSTFAPPIGSRRTRVAIAVILGLAAMIAVATYRARFGSSKSLVESHDASALVDRRPGEARYWATEELRRLDQALARSPADYAFQILRAETLRSRGRIDEAARAVDRSLALHPDLINAHVIRTLIELGRGRTRNALQSARTAVALNPGEPFAREVLAASLAASGDRASAIAQYEFVLATAANAPLRRRVEVALALVYDAERNYSAALRHVEDALASAPADLSALDAKARIFENSFPGTKEAADNWEKLVRANPDHVDAHLFVARALASQDRFDEALDHLETAYRLDSSYTYVLFERAQILVRLGRLADARNSLYECLKKSGTVLADADLFEKARLFVLEVESAMRAVEDEKRSGKTGIPESAPSESERRK